MRHHKNKRIFGRDAGQRKALLKSLALALIKHGHIMTTHAKAKELRPFIEPLVTRAKNNTLANKRYLFGHLGNTEQGAIKKLMEQVAPPYATRAGGYTRIIKIENRGSDNAAMARIEFV